MVHGIFPQDDGQLINHFNRSGVTVLTKLKTIELKLPASTELLRTLEIGTVAYLTGRLFTSREGAYKRAIEEGGRHACYQD